MERYQVILAYDGSLFQGFQRQGSCPGDVRTVQGVVEAALRRLGWQGTSILAAGRTDTGVHASGQVIAFDLEWRHTPEKLLKALNAYLPSDVAARQVQVTSSDFHPRFDAVARHYRYTVYVCDTRDPLRERYTWRVWPLLDFACLCHAASLLVGKHDFAAFGTPPRALGSTIRSINVAKWHQSDDQLFFDISADAFLYHMVRRMVYVQVTVARNWIEIDALRQALENPVDAIHLLKPGLAPPNGLTMVDVSYVLP